MGIFDWWRQTELIKLGLWTQWQSVSCTRLWAEMWSVYARVSPGWPCKGQKWSFNKQNAAFVTYGPHFFPRIPEIQMYTRHILDPLHLIPAACSSMWIITSKVCVSFLYSHWWLCGRSGRRFGTRSTDTQRWPSPGCTFRRRRRPPLRRTSPRTSPGPWTLAFLEETRAESSIYSLHGRV